MDPEARKRKDARRKVRRLEARANGLCASCLKVPYEKSRSQCANCAKKWNAKAKARRAKIWQPGFCKRHPKDEVVAGYATCVACRVLQKAPNRAEATRKWNQKRKRQIHTGYGGKCACCDETCPEFLSIDHIHNDGSTERARGMVGSRFINWLIANDFPKDRYQLLCFNCNYGKRITGGVCPHRLGGPMNV